jgi:hypothetical protein
VIAVVARSTRRSFVMMISILGKTIGNRAARSTNKHWAGLWRP